MYKPLPLSADFCSFKNILPTFFGIIKLSSFRQIVESNALGNQLGNLINMSAGISEENVKEFSFDVSEGRLLTAALFSSIPVC